jgi:hypothetical protein
VLPATWQLPVHPYGAIARTVAEGDAMLGVNVQSLTTHDAPSMLTPSLGKVKLQKVRRRRQKQNTSWW